jgi:hypothetical protein
MKYSWTPEMEVSQNSKSTSAESVNDAPALEIVNYFQDQNPGNGGWGYTFIQIHQKINEFLPWTRYRQRWCPFCSVKTPIGFTETKPFSTIRMSRGHLVPQ